MSVQADDVLFAWSARDHSGEGSCGVTDEPGLAEKRLHAALDALRPGAVGVVELVRLDWDARQPSYVHGAVVLRSRRKARGPGISAVVIGRG
ncbi:hypothetical protein ACIBP6_29840 [Nonomuraea terrae]|uniref:hypothetical protein n=1 Tax=Nonomuraea terrae TaxID=2530383 RepID=UPI00379A2D25